MSIADYETEEGVFDFIFNYVDKASFLKYFRVVIIICGYVIIRGLYMNWAGKYHIRKQVERDEKEKAEKPSKDAKAKAELEEKLANEAKTFGWGKKTRKDNKLKEAIIEREFNELRQRQQSAYDAAEDHDIEDLLED